VQLPPRFLTWQQCYRTYQYRLMPKGNAADEAKQRLRLRYPALEARRGSPHRASPAFPSFSTAPQPAHWPDDDMRVHCQSEVENQCPPARLTIFSELTV
jgi:hypothetical protein